jgi:hypothetical protein
MNKYVLYIIIIVVVVGAIMAGGWFIFYNKDEVVTDSTTQAVANLAPPVANIDTTVLEVVTENGDIEVATETVTHNNITFTLSSATQAADWHTKTAPSGQEYVVVYFSPIAAEVREVTGWVQTDARLTAGNGTQGTLAELKIVGTGGSADDTGYVAFLVAAGLSDFTFGFGDTTVALGF